MTEKEQKEIFASNLNYYLDKKGIEKIQLAEAIGVTKGAVTQWTQGLTTPRMGKVQAIANFLGVRTTDLINERGNPGMPNYTITAEDIEKIKFCDDNEALVYMFGKASPSEKEMTLRFLRALIESEQ